MSLNCLKVVFCWHFEKMDKERICPDCGTVKPDSMFSQRRKECKDCAAILYRTKYYQKRIDNLKTFRNELRKDAVCTKCGESNPLMLDFAHYDREKKTAEISNTLSIRTLRKELEQGRHLCIWCHRIETKEENDMIKSEREHRYTEVEDQEILLLTKRQCQGSLCHGKERNLHHFYSFSDKRKRHCKRCLRYAMFLKRRNLSSFVDSIKLKRGECASCAIQVSDKTLCCFDFDHLNQKDKTDSISNMVSKAASKKLILFEIDKCQFLCCRCHRRKSDAERKC